MEEKNKLIKMHNNLVEAHIRECLTSEEWKLFYEILSKINTNKKYKGKEKVGFFVKISEFINKTDKTATNFKYLLDVVDRLSTRSMGYIDLVKKEFDFRPIFNRLSNKVKKGYLYVEINPSALPLLLELKKDFTSFYKEEVFKLASKYSLALYKLLKRFEDTGKRIDKIEDLRMKLGIRINEYKRFFDFERWVLKKAVEEINEKTDLEVSYKKRKTGRRISHIEFHIKVKSDTVNNDIEKQIKEEVKMLNQGDTTETKKMPSQTIDNKGQKEEKIKSSAKEKNLEKIWSEIGKIRKKYEKILNEILPKVSRLNENQILFLLVNVNDELIPLDIAKDIILVADRNKALNNPMGFLINQFNIDMKQAKYKELTLTPKKIDQEIFVEKLKEKYVAFTQPKEMIAEYWNNHIVPLVKEGKIRKLEAKLLKEPITKMVYDDIENIIYIPTPDIVYRDWLESNFLEDIKSFFKERFDVDDVVVELVEEDKK